MFNSFHIEKVFFLFIVVIYQKSTILYFTTKLMKGKCKTHLHNSDSPLLNATHNRTVGTSQQLLTEGYNTGAQ